MKYSVGDYVAVTMKYEETEMYKNSDGIFDVRVINHTTEIVADIIESLNGSNTIFCENTGLVRIDQISPANTDQINAVRVASQGVQSMLKAGENILESIQEPEYI